MRRISLILFAVCTCAMAACAPPQSAETAANTETTNTSNAEVPPSATEDVALPLPELLYSGSAEIRNRSLQSMMSYTSKQLPAGVSAGTVFKGTNSRANETPTSLTLTILGTAKRRPGRFDTIEEFGDGSGAIPVGGYFFPVSNVAIFLSAELVNELKAQGVETLYGRFSGQKTRWSFAALLPDGTLRGYRKSQSGTVRMVVLSQVQS